MCVCVFLCVRVLRSDYQQTAHNDDVPQTGPQISTRDKHTSRITIEDLAEIVAFSQDRKENEEENLWSPFKAFTPKWIRT